MRKALLTVHVAISVSWLGSAYAAFVVAVVARGTDEADVQWVGHDILHVFDLVVMRPFALAALVTGIAVAVGTPWGLLRRYWVVAKFTMTLVLILFGVFFQSQWIERAATMTARLDTLVVGVPVVEIIAGAMVAMAVLTATTALSIYKPWGTIRFGRRRHSISSTSL